MTTVSSTPTVSSSSTLWATASKEWIIQPKPKPGRKPKKDLASSAKDEEEVDTKGRRIQNRAAQRAFRERKQSQLAELQARVQSYEQGEIERNVALQNIAKRLKDENENLRRENLLLKDKVSRMETERITQESEKKRWRDDSPASTTSLQLPARKRTRASPNSPHSRLPPLSTTYMSSPPSMASSPDSNGTSDTHFSPVPYTIPGDHDNALSSLLDFSSNAKPVNLESTHPFPAFDCGFCSEDTPCVCREIALQQASDRAALTNNFGHTNVIPQANRTVRLEAPPEPPRSTILENLPAYQPPVPLRRRVSGSPATPIFPVQLASTVSLGPQVLANCSGDPTNCMACADDVFGKAFCSAIGKSIASKGTCSDCPSGNDVTFKYEDKLSHSGCTSNRLDCERCSSSPSHPLSSAINDTDTIPTNDAWRQIKAHPNVAFTDLALLADVVASRAKCMGPKLVLTPPPATPDPGQNIDSNTSRNSPQPDHEPVLLTDPHARYREKERAQMLGGTPTPQLVTQEVVLRCGRQVREVPIDSVRDALRLLDSKFS